MRNHKSTIILSGSFIELLFTYFCFKKKYSKISYLSPQSGKSVSKKVYEATLIDFILFFEQNKLFKNSITAISNISRMYRNFVHPGLEIKESESLDDSKIEICFHGVLQVVDEIL